MTVRILNGDAIDVLRTLPAESVHCCVTSPPYWGLRDYGVPSSVWGGDPDCDHSFGEEITQSLRGAVGERSTIDGDQSRSGSRLEKVRNGSFCRCGAWRGCLGLEPTPELFVEHCVAAFREVYRVLRDDGALWLNIGDCYASNSAGARTQNGLPSNRNRKQEAVCASNNYRGNGVKGKDLVGIPWMLAFALRADGWYLRSEIIWHKPNPMPESVTDRPTRAHEQVFLLSKSAKYFYDLEAIRLPPSGISGGACFGGPLKEQRAQATVGSALRTQQRAVTKQDRQRYASQGANSRSVWTIPTFAFPEAHFATFPPKLAAMCIKAGTSERGCCPQCGEPWVRTTERTYDNPGNRSTNGPRSIARKHQTHGTAGYGIRLEKKVKTTGWNLRCKCDACEESESVPCTVLDPFGGAGTTGLVADRLGRDAVLIELNPEYAKLARRRICEDAGMFADVDTVEAET